jgi:predicted transglutaminase-like cysteine proteinase
MKPVFSFSRIPAQMGLVGVLVAGLATTAPLAAKTFSFTYAGKQRQFTWDIPQDDLTFYNAQSHVQGIGKTYADFAKEEGGHVYLTDLTNAIKRSAAAEGLSEWETVNYAVALVQNLNYFNDPQPYQDYVRYPIETLDEDGGDCEDTAILLAAILDRMGYSAALLNPPGHMAAGIECADCIGTKVSYNGKEYYYIETTGSGFNIGQMVLNFTSFNVFELDHSRDGKAIVSNDAPSGISPGSSPGQDDRILQGGGGSQPFVFEMPDIKPFTMPDMGGGDGTYKTSTLPDGTTIISYTFGSSPNPITPLEQSNGIAEQIRQIQQLQQQQIQQIQHLQLQQMESMRQQMQKAFPTIVQR